MAEQSIIPNNDLQLLAIPQLMGKHFFIPEYQRGYRWEEKQIYQLLEDLWKYFFIDEDKGDFYCLQPIVVKECARDVLFKYSDLLEDISSLAPYDSGEIQEGPKNNVWYEVIDGQQRLTTIRIIMAYYNAWHFANEKFTIKYATRPKLSDIFDNLNIDARNNTVELSNIFSYSNVDVEYVKEAAKMIIDWFLDDSVLGIANKRNKLSTFLSDFFTEPKPGTPSTKEKSVQVIWYETKEKTDARDIFERLNNLKVPLSSSELIRAIFLSKDSTYEYRFTKEQDTFDEEDKKRILKNHNDKKKLDINSKWDEIEHYFRNEKFWAFITNRNSNDFRNRIELLFDLISGKSMSKNESDRIDRLFTYLYFDKKKNDLDGLWATVIRYYDTLRYWFENKDYYHKIGYLIYQGGERTLIELLSYANDDSHRKSDFEKELNLRITSSINRTKQFSRLDYNDKNSGYPELKKLLFLYNVEFTRTEVRDSWFPFSEYKKEEQEGNGWTLEHIHAQNSECLNPNSRIEWRDWVFYTIKARENIGDPVNNSFLDKLKRILILLEEDIANKTHKVKFEEDIKVLFNEDLNLWSNGAPHNAMHQLSNLALLSGDVNSGIGKGSFSVKQQYINKCIADEKYIPICTQRVFLKHYYNDEVVNDELLHQQLISWSDSDRECYLKSIKRVLGTYFKPEEF